MASIGGLQNAAAQSYSFRDYGQSDGLQGMSVSSLLEDHQGVLWVGTELGLHRYERERFILIGPEHGLDARYIRGLAEDDQGRLWVASTKGLFVGKDDQFVQVLRNGKRINSENGNVLTADHDGALVISNQELLRVSPSADGRWQVTPVPLRLENGHVLQAGRALLLEHDQLWVACEQSICKVAKDGSVTQLGAAEHIPRHQWRAIFRDSHGRLWLRGGGLLLSRSPGQQQFVVHPAPQGATFETLADKSNLIEDTKGRVLTRADHGLVRWEGDHWRYFGQNQDIGLTSLPGTLLMQRNGSLWIGTRGLGLQRWLGYDMLEHWDEHQGLALAPIWSIQRLPSGELIVSGDTGSNLLDSRNGRVRPWTLANGQPLRSATSFALTSDDAAWLALTSGKIARRDPRSGRTENILDLGVLLHKLIFADGTLWIASAQGIYRMAPTPPYKAHLETALPVTDFAYIAQDHAGRLWTGSRQGLYLREHGQWRQVKVSGQIPHLNFFQIDFAQDDEIWVSLVDTGLWHGRLDTHGVLQLKAVDDPLISRIMPYIVRHDAQDRLWVGSSQGLDLYMDGLWTRITQSEGLLWDDLSANAFFADDDGSLWIGSSRGLSHLRDPAALFARHRLQVKVNRVQHDEQILHPGSEIAWSDAPLEVELSTPGAEGSPERINFYYRVKGHQARWSTTTQSHITYPLLPSGNYELQVQAIDVRQRLRSPVVGFQFRLIPPWWRGPIALTFYFLAALATVFAILRWRTRNLVKRKRELERMIAERTAELEQDKCDLEAARAELALKATHDELTGLLNRAGILDALRELMRVKQPLAVLLIDLDHFKQVNDEHGHLVGDVILAGVGYRLNAQLRGQDKVGRYGGEELLALLPGLKMDALHRIHKLHSTISGIYSTTNGELTVTCSIGVAWYHDEENVEQLLARADIALYKAKNNGRNRIEYSAEDLSITPSLREC